MVGVPGVGYTVADAEPGGPLSGSPFVSVAVRVSGAVAPSGTGPGVKLTVAPLAVVVNTPPEIVQEYVNPRRGTAIEAAYVFPEVSLAATVIAGCVGSGKTTAVTRLEALLSPPALVSVQVRVSNPVDPSGTTSGLRLTGFTQFAVVPCESGP